MHREFPLLRMMCGQREVPSNIRASGEGLPAGATLAEKVAKPQRFGAQVGDIPEAMDPHTVYDRGAAEA